MILLADTFPHGIAYIEINIWRGTSIEAKSWPVNSNSIGLFKKVELISRETTVLEHKQDLTRSYEPQSRIYKEHSTQEAPL